MRKNAFISFRHLNDSTISFPPLPPLEIFLFFINLLNVKAHIHGISELTSVGNGFSTLLLQMTQKAKWPLCCAQHTQYDMHLRFNPLGNHTRYTYITTGL